MFPCPIPINILWKFLENYKIKATHTILTKTKVSIWLNIKYPKFAHNYSKFAYNFADHKEIQIESFQWITENFLWLSPILCHDFVKNNYGQMVFVRKINKLDESLQTCSWRWNSTSFAPSAILSGIRVKMRWLSS